MVLNDFVFEDGKAQEYFFIVTGKVIAHPYVTLGSDLYVRCTDTREKLWRKASVTEDANVLPICAFVGHGFVQRLGSEWRKRHCTGYRSFSTL